MAFYLIGLGLGNKGVSIEGLAAGKKCKYLYVDSYTSKAPHEVQLKQIFGKNVRTTDRSMLEEGFEVADGILQQALKFDVGLLVGGDPLSATTHIEMMRSCKNAGVEVRVIHAGSIFSAVAEAGLQLYKFGRTASITFPRGGKQPKSAYDAIVSNKKQGLHTLLLLDLQNGIYLDADSAIKMILQQEAQFGKKALKSSDKIVVYCGLGFEGNKIKYCKAEHTKDFKEGPFPQCIAVPGKLHFAEKEALEELYG